MEWKKGRNFWFHSGSKVWILSTLFVINSPLNNNKKQTCKFVSQGLRGPLSLEIIGWVDLIDKRMGDKGGLLSSVLITEKQPHLFHRTLAKFTCSHQLLKKTEARGQVRSLDRLLGSFIRVPSQAPGTSWNTLFPPLREMHLFWKIVFRNSRLWDSKQESLEEAPIGRWHYCPGPGTPSVEEFL